MQSLFDNHSRESIRTRLLNLKPDSKAQWGKFDVNKMLAHCIDTFEVGFGEREVVVKKGILNSGFGRWLVIDSPIPWGKSPPTLPEYFLVTKPTEFARDHQRVLDYLDRFAKGRDQKWGISPFLGNLTPDQWSRLHYRHLNHHLTQFGC